ncbi:hypothetical protein K501DRAFT_279559 [Backusella circina FSU 941]|nr:hypothetical protein K501DRAFT_279559 [Backusella circina FSU 941]
MAFDPSHINLNSFFFSSSDVPVQHLMRREFTQKGRHSVLKKVGVIYQEDFDLDVNKHFDSDRDLYLCKNIKTEHLKCTKLVETENSMYSCADNAWYSTKGAMFENRKFPV